MKHIFLFCCLLPLLAFQMDSMNEIAQAIKNGDANGLGKYMTDPVELTILGEEGNYTKAQAVQKLQTFFSQNKPMGFSQMHEGTSKGQGSKYCLGNLETNGKTYRIYYLVAMEGTAYKLQELRIE